MSLFKQVFHSKDELLQSITTDILTCERDPHRSLLKLNTSKPTKTTITCHNRLCSFRCEFTRKKNKDEWTSTKNNRVHKHLRDNCLELNKIRRPSDFVVTESSTTASPLPTLANCRKSIIPASPDGYCGYHSVSLAAHRDQKHTKEVIQKILATLQTNAATYSRMNFEVEKLRERIRGALNWKGKALPKEFQFNGFECAQLVADTYKRPVVILQEDSVAI